MNKISNTVICRVWYLHKIKNGFYQGNAVTSITYRNKRAALKVMPPVLLVWPTASEADVGGMAAEV